MLMRKDGDLEEDEEDGSLLSILRRIQVIPKQEEDWKCTSILRTIMLCETKSQMLIIDGGCEIMLFLKLLLRG